MAKYIIDIANDDYLNLWKCEEGKCVLAETYTTSDLTPYTEPDEDEIREKEAEYGEKAWQLFRNICELNGTECIEAFDTISCRTVLDEMTYSEAKAKYDEWAKEKSRIRVGDEVIIKFDGVKGVILDEDSCGEFSVFTENGCCEAYRKINFEKTGRHLNSVEKLLEEMRNE